LDLKSIEKQLDKIIHEDENGSHKFSGD
jgi:hypothetical protein